jgi:hypothetical protein
MSGAISIDSPTPTSTPNLKKNTLYMERGHKSELENLSKFAKN